ncbi:ABC transporter ATP-binding protein [Endothiovibrio diazotrophicus]
MTLPLLETKGLRVAIGGKRVCDGLDLAIRAGECWGVLGGNGVGKSTLLHTLAGLFEADGGELILEGEPLAALPRRRIARRLGLLLQDHGDPFPATVLETALIGRHPHLQPWQFEGEEEQRRAAAALAAVELEGFEGRMVATLSGGERRRLGLATLLVQDPALMLLDEPANHLDLRHQIRLLRLIARLTHSQPKAALMVLHDPNLAARFCDRLLLLFEGGETAAGPTGELLDEANLTRLYGHPVRRIADGNGEAWLAG